MFLKIINLFCDGMTGNVLSNGNSSAQFRISNGVTHGCILALVLFNMFFTYMVSNGIQDLEEAVYLKYFHDSSLLISIISDQIYVHICTWYICIYELLQLMCNRFVDAAKLFGLNISLARQRCSTKWYQTPFLQI